MEFVQLQSSHEDIVHDVAFDYYGKRFASCSSDKQIKVWDFDDEQNQWMDHTIPRAHADTIWRLSWAHPEFGQILASCSSDRSVHIWEEWESTQAAVRKTDNKDQWHKKAQLSDSRGSVNDVKFAPRHLGLKVSTASSDGTVRVYEATDVFTLNYWPLQEAFQVECSTNRATTKGGGAEAGHDDGLKCLSWCDSPFEEARLVVGGYRRHLAVWKCDSNGKWREELLLSEQPGTVHDVAWAVRAFSCSLYFPPFFLSFFSPPFRSFFLCEASLHSSSHRVST